jgi:hypothetical protein
LKNFISFAIAVIILTTFIVINEKKPPTATIKNKSKKLNDNDIKTVLQKILSVFGIDVATNVELIYRNETAHFTSGQFLNGYSAGMENFSKKGEFPYGWGKTLINFSNTYPDYKPTGLTKPIVEGQKTGKKKVFVKFPNLEAAMFFLAIVLKARGNDVGKWHSNDIAAQTEYRRRLNTIKPKTINSLT